MLIDNITHFTANNGNIWYYLMPVLIFGAAIWLYIEIAFRISGFMMAKAFPKLEAQIRMMMFEYVQDHSYSYFANHFAGNISNRINDMTQSATRILQLVITLFIPAFIAIIIASIIFYTISPWFALLLSGWTALHIGICLLGAPKCARLSSIHADSRSFLTGKVVDAFTNIANIKLFAKKRYECEYIYKYQQDERKKYSAALAISEKIKIILGISAFTFPGVLMIWYVIHSWQHGLISIGSLVLIFNTTWNIQFLTWLSGLELPNLYKEIGICQQAISLVKAEYEVKDRQDAQDIKINNGKIAFEKVDFHYLKGKNVFNSLTVTIDPGKKIGLVGFSGSGKSTFVNLIMRFFNISSGKIQIDNIETRNFTLQSLRSQISVIPQDPSLFHRTLRENIAYGNTNASDDDIIDASKRAHCHQFIENLPQGYDTLVGERGVKLSGGQRQRIAIARAILKNAPILILDEATCALDSVTEKYIQDALHQLMKNKTTIVIAHRLSTLFDMDRILVFDNGKIVEEGTHQDLCKANGHYARMWKMQADGFLPDTPNQIN